MKPVVSVTLAGLKPGRPPIERLLVDVQLENAGSEARWALLPSRLPETPGGIDKLEQLTSKAAAGTVSVGRFLGTGGCYAVRLAAGASVKLRNLEISWWRDNPNQKAVKFDVRLATTVDLGDSPMVSWFEGNPTFNGASDVDMQSARHTASHRALGDKEVPLSAIGMTVEVVGLIVP